MHDLNYDPQESATPSSSGTSANFVSPVNGGGSGSAAPAVNLAVQQKDERSTTRTLLNVGLLGVAAYGVYYLFFKSDDSSTELTDDQKQLLDDAAQTEYDPTLLLPDDEAPISITWTDDQTDYDTCQAVAEQFKADLAQQASDTLSHLAALDSATLGKLFYIAGSADEEIYPTMMDLYAKLLGYWEVYSKPFIEASSSLMTAAVQYMGDSIERSLQPSEIIFMKDVTEYASFEESITTRTINKKTSAGLLNIGSFNVLGGSTESRETIIANKASTTQSRRVTWVPHVVDYQVDPDLYALALEETSALTNAAFLVLAGTIDKAPKLEQFVNQVISE